MSIAGAILTAIWSLGAAILLLRLGIANWFVSQLRANSQLADAEMTELCRQTPNTLGLRTPDLKLSSRIHSPCLIGIVRPAILLPQGDAVSRSVLRDVFLHELAHLARRDCLFHLLSRLATAVLFFQPLVWWLSRRLEQIADDVCDDYVVQYGTNRKNYAHTLVDFAEQLPAQWATANAGLGMVSLRSSLSRRVLRILDSSRSIALRPSPLWILAIALIGVSATVSAALIVNAPASSTADASETDTATAKDDESASKDTKDEEKKVSDEASDDGAKPTTDSKSETTKPDNKKKAAKLPTYKFRGKVVDPGGKPFSGAKVYFYSWRFEIPGVLGTTNEKGEFAYDLAPSNPAYAQVSEDGGAFMAIADGYGLAVKSTHECETTGEMMRAFQRRVAIAPTPPAFFAEAMKRLLKGSTTFQLKKDDVPLTGTVVDVDGQPVAGAKLQIAKVTGMDKGELDAWEKDARKPDATFYSLNRFVRMSVGSDVGGRVLEMISPAVTDKNGKFMIKGLGRDRIVRMVISEPGIATSRVYARTRDGEPIEIIREPRVPNRKMLYHPAKFTHVAGPSQAVEGIVFDAKTKKPMAGVTLQSYHLPGQRFSGWTEGFINTVTNEKGHFRLDGLPIGRNEVMGLSSLDEPYLATRFRAETTAGGEPLQKRVEITRGLWIEGKAYDKTTGEPIRSGQVDYFAFTTNLHAKSVQGYNGAHIANRYRLNPDGTYRVPGLPGRGIVGVMADRDHQKYQRGAGAEKIEGKDQEINVFRTYPHIASAFNFHVVHEVNPKEDDKVVKVNFELDSGNSLTVKVVDTDGKPVTGGIYTGLMEYGIWQSYRGNDLKINGYRPSKPRRVQVYHQKRKLAGMIVIGDEDPKDLRVTLHPSAEISGRLLDSAGVPKANARLGNAYREIRDDSELAVLPPHPNQYAGQRDFKTDKDGRFKIIGLVANRVHTLSASETRKNGIGYYLGEIDADLKLRPGETRDLGDVTLKARK